MPRTLVSLIGMCLLSAVTAGSQTTVPPTLPAALQPHVKAERFQIVTSVRGLPLGVRDAMQTLFGGATLDIAEAGMPFQVTDVVMDPKLPIRRLVTAGCSPDHCLIYYERGGVAHTWHAALFHWTPDATRLEAGGAAPNSLVTIDDVRTAILSGTIKTSNKYW